MGTWNFHIVRVYARRLAFGGALAGFLVAIAVIASHPEIFLSFPYMLVVLALPIVLAGLGYGSLFVFGARSGYWVPEHPMRGRGRRRKR